MAVSAVKKESAKNQDATGAATAPVASLKKNRKYLKLLIILIFLGGIGGGAYWYWNQQKNHKPSEAKAQPAKPPVFVPLEPFTVNLQLEDSPQFLQTGLSLKVSDNTVVDALKLHMPEVRDRILLLLSNCKASQLLTLEGKRKLSSDIVATVNAILAPSAPETTPPAKASQAAAPATAGEAAAPTEGSAEGGDKPVQEAAAPAAPAQPPIVSVLFTSFIVQ